MSSTFKIKPENQHSMLVNMLAGIMVDVYETNKMLRRNYCEANDIDFDSFELDFMKKCIQRLSEIQDDLFANFGEIDNTGLE